MSMKDIDLEKSIFDDDYDLLEEWELEIIEKESREYEDWIIRRKMFGYGQEQNLEKKADLRKDIIDGLNKKYNLPSRSEYDLDNLRDIYEDYHKDADKRQANNRRLPDIPDNIESDKALNIEK